METLIEKESESGKNGKFKCKRREENRTHCYGKEMVRDQEKKKNGKIERNEKNRENRAEIRTEILVDEP